MTRARRASTGYYLATDPPGWAPSSSQWRGLETSFGHPIPTDLRDAVAEIVAEYFHASHAEQSASSVADATAYLQSLERKAKALIKALAGDLPDAAARNTRDFLCDYYWFNPRAPQKGGFGKVAKIQELVNSLIDAARSLKSDLRNEKECDPKNKKNKAKNEGKRASAWDCMIVDLTKTLTQRGLPTSVNKGTDKSKTDDPSGFVRLIMGLQASFPVEFRRYHIGHDGWTSYDATAAAVSKAQSAYRKYVAARDDKSRKNVR